MHEQPDGIPAEPPGHVPPPPPYPPSPASGYPPPGHPTQVQQQPPGAQWYPSAPPGYAPPPPARRSRVGLWVALGVVGALLVSGMAYGLTAGSDSPSSQDRPDPAPPGQAGGGAGGASVGGSSDSGQQAPAGGNRPLARISLPDTFMGLTRNDDDEIAQMLRQMDQSEQQNMPVRPDSTVYGSGRVGRGVIQVRTYESDDRASDEDIRRTMARSWAPFESPYMRITYGPVSTVDPGPFGGILQCAQSVITTDSPDIFGNRISSGVECIWEDTNTIGILMFDQAVSGQSVARGADVARKFRAAAESRR